MNKGKKEKRFRDPNYGYIEIDEELVHTIIDTAGFQRLRDIRQTSYAPLYPSALNNRFVHSLGVYHLGKMAFSALKKNVASQVEFGKEIPKTYIKNISRKKWERYEWLFSLACLLHDVGHAPFSHTGEKFYINSKSKEKIQINQKKLSKMLKNIPETDRGMAEKTLKEQEYSIYRHLAYLSGDAVFATPKGGTAAAHEIMSCIVALTAFKSQFKNEDEKSFFSRCITGITYDEKVSKEQTKDEYERTCEKMLCDCFIQLLNSKVIDVDRLDYIIRDANMMGYQSMSIDYERLLNGFILAPIDEESIKLGFRKDSISVIENAVYAHDLMKKWIQSHPVILYDSFLIQRSIAEIEHMLMKNNTSASSTLFSYDSLTAGGSKFDSIQVRWLNDADILYIMKSECKECTYVDEYFRRDIRCHPLWKSEAEYKHFFTEQERELLNKKMNMLISTERNYLEINDNTLEQVKIDPNDIPPKVAAANFKKQIFQQSLSLCEKYGIRRKLIMISTSLFNSNFSKGQIQNIAIQFDDRISIFKDVSVMLFSEEVSSANMWYLFYYPSEKGKMNNYEFAREFMEIYKKSELVTS